MLDSGSCVDGFDGGIKDIEVSDLALERVSVFGSSDRLQTSACEVDGKAKNLDVGGEREIGGLVDGRIAGGIEVFHHQAD